MGDNIQNPYIQSTSPPTPPHTSKSNLQTLYYGVAVIGTTTIVFTFYYIIVLKWCFFSSTSQSDEESTTSSSVQEESVSDTARNFVNNKLLLSSFKYNKERKEQGESGTTSSTIDIYECAVCLSVFEDGEEVRILPKCKHSFHALCIDKWLFSHSDCPLCRTPMPVSTPYCCHDCRQSVTHTPEENSREVLLDTVVSG